MREIEELLKFIKNSPSMFHTIETISKELKAAGFQYLPETRDWELKAGGAYYTTRKDVYKRQESDETFDSKRTCIRSSDRTGRYQ